MDIRKSTMGYYCNSSKKTDGVRQPLTPITPVSDEEFAIDIKKASTAIDYLLINSERLAREAQGLQSKMKRIKRYLTEQNKGE